MTNPVPFYAVPQPDGSAVGVDFSAPGSFGDFAFRVHLPDGARRLVMAYHAVESSIFMAVLQHWARTATPEDVLAGITTVRAELDALTVGRTPTTASENDFRHHLDDIRALAVLDVLPAVTDFHDEAGNKLTLIPTSECLTVISEYRDRDTVTIEVANRDLAIFPIGMIWRSYQDPEGGPPLTRLNTRTYLEALDTFEQAIRDRLVTT